MTEFKSIKEYKKHRSKKIDRYKYKEDMKYYSSLEYPDKAMIIEDLQLSELQKVFIVELIKQKFHIWNTTKHLQISDGQFHVWKKNCPHFRRAVEILTELRTDFIEDKFMELVDEKNPQAILFGLKTLGRNRGYIESSDISQQRFSEITINIGEVVKTIDVEPIHEPEQIDQHKDKTDS